MANIQEISKKALYKLEKDNQPIIPSNYFMEFKNQAQLAKVDIDDIKIFNKINERLTPDERCLIKVNSFKDLATILVERTTTEELKSLIEVLNDLLAPSADFSVIEEIQDFIINILKDPKKLVADASIKKLKEISKHRVDGDRKVLKDKTNDIIKLTSLMSRYFDKTLSDSDNSTEEISKIKDDLVNLNISDASHRELKLVQKQLIDTIYKLENSMRESKEIINTNKEKFDFLYKQIEELQKELEHVKEEQQIDFLTNILNRRGYHCEMEKMEKKFAMFNGDYAVIFFDIDHFKQINDVYGHNCGDAVLRNFALILKDLTRKEDVLARYGGEEFIALINYHEEVEIQRYTKRVRKAISNTNFRYKDTDIKVNFSAGVSHRRKYDSFSEAKKRADELLYEAKHNGRDKIIFDSGIVL